MQTGIRISAIGHGVLIVLALFGLPWFGPRDREPIRVTEVSFVSEAEFEAAQAAAPAEAPRADDAPPELPAPRPAETAPESPEPVAEAEAEPQAEVAALEPPAAEPEETPELPARVTPRVVTLPPTAATPPVPRPAARVAPAPTPTPPEEVRPAEIPKPVLSPAPEAEVARVEEPPAAPPEAAPAPEAAPVPEATLALETSARPMPRQVRPAAASPDEAETVMAALKREVAREQARRSQSEATPATEPSVTAPTPASAPATTSLPVGPPLTSAEKDGLKLAVQRCWNVPAGLRDAHELKVTLAAELGADGNVINASIRLIEPSPAPDGRFQQAYEAGRRALIRCAPYGELPRDKFAQWRNIEVVFNPEGMVSW